MPVTALAMMESFHGNWFAFLNVFSVSLTTIWLECHSTVAQIVSMMNLSQQECCVEKWIHHQRWCNQLVSMLSSSSHWMTSSAKRTLFLLWKILIAMCVVKQPRKFKKLCGHSNLLCSIKLVISSLFSSIALCLFKLGLFCCCLKHFLNVHGNLAHEKTWDRTH